MKSLRLSTALPVLFLLFVVAGYVVYPLVVTIRQSLLAGEGFSFANYRVLLDPGNRGNMEAVWNSVSVSILSVLFSGVVGTVLAFGLTQIQFPGRTVLSRLAIVPIALPPLVGVIAFLFVFGESGILPRVIQKIAGTPVPIIYLNGFGAIVAIHVYSFYVYFYLFVSTALRQIDASLMEAASGLGSSPWKTFRRVVFPELRPALVGASILTFMASMASFSAPLLFAGERRFITLLIYTTKLNGEMNLAAAQSILLTLVAVTFFVVMQVLAGREVRVGRAKGVPRTGTLPIGSVMQVVFVAVIVLMLLLVLLPLITIVLISFAREGSWTVQILPGAYTTENYARLFTDPRILEPIRNSLVMGLVTLIAVILVGVTGAYLITKGVLRRARTVLDVVLTLPYAIPGTVIAVSLILAFNVPTAFSGFQVLVGTFWILPLAYFIRLYPLVVRSTTAALEQLDDALLEAGESFGAGPWTRFRRIALPLILPGIVSGALLTVISAIGEFVSSILLYTYSSRPISVEILSQLRTFNFGAAAAYCVMLLLLILVIVWVSNAIVSKASSRGKLSGGSGLGTRA
jgi:iron(III) transport system permease protein